VDKLVGFKELSNSIKLTSNHRIVVVFSYLKNWDVQFQFINIFVKESCLHREIKTTFTEQTQKINKIPTYLAQTLKI